MAVLMVGSENMKAGIEYSGLVPNGNAFRMTEDVRVSINRKPWVLLDMHEDIYVLSSITYSFERDTTILLTRVVQQDLSIIWNKQCPGDVSLDNGVESATVCSVTALETTTVGTIAYVVYIENARNQSANSIVRVYVDGVLTDTATYEIPSNETMQAGKQFDITTAINPAQVISFTVEAQSTNQTVRGSVVSSQVQVNRIS